MTEFLKLGHFHQGDVACHLDELTIFHMKRTDRGEWEFEGLTHDHKPMNGNIHKPRGAGWLICVFQGGAPYFGTHVDNLQQAYDALLFCHQQKQLFNDT